MYAFNSMQWQYVHTCRVGQSLYNSTYRVCASLLWSPTASILVCMSPNSVQSRIFTILRMFLYIKIHNMPSYPVKKIDYKNIIYLCLVRGNISFNQNNGHSLYRTSFLFKDVFSYLILDKLFTESLYLSEINLIHTYGPAWSAHYMGLWMFCSM